MGSLGWKPANVYAEDALDQLFVGEWRPARGLREGPLARVCPQQECAASTRRIKHPVVGIADAEGVDEVYHIG